jgi:uncharacterized protein
VRNAGAQLRPAVREPGPRAGRPRGRNPARSRPKRTRRRGALRYTRTVLQPSYLLAGFAVGALVGLTGIGGGSLMTPLLVVVFGQPPLVAVGTDLLLAAVTKGVATALHGFRSRVDWPILGRLALGSLPTALLTVIWLGRTDRPRATVDAFILHSLGGVLIGTCVVLILLGPLRRISRRFSLGVLSRFQRLQPIFTVLTGVLLGLAVTLTSVGAGALGTVALFYLYPLRLTPVKLVATDLAHALPLTLIAGLGHAALGNVDWMLLANLVCGSVPGVVLGTRGASYAPAWLLRSLIAVMLGVTGLRLLIR